MTSVTLVTVLRAAGRAGVAVCLWGDPGIGKSALISCGLRVERKSTRAATRLSGRGQGLLSVQAQHGHWLE
jgi:DNA replicative helicase MCM subunit Mcm2 (Cdc46/Mcm family)